VSNDVLVGIENPVGQPVVPHELPDILDRIELGTFGWERNDGDVGGDFQLARGMPTGLIDQYHGVRIGCYLA